MGTIGSTFYEVAEEIQTTNENKEFPQQAQATNESNDVPQQAQATNEDNEVPKQAQATNESNDIPQQAQATNEYDEVPQQTHTINEDNTVAVAEDACQGGGLMAWVSGDWHQSWVSKKWRQWRRRPVLHCSYMDADPNVIYYKVIYTELIEGSTKTPYPFKFHDPAHIITGIACLPKDAETSSPEVEVVRGGVGSKEVEIILTPVEKGNWCCRVLINGKEDNRLEMDSTSYKKLTM